MDVGLLASSSVNVIAAVVPSSLFTVTVVLDTDEEAAARLKELDDEYAALKFREERLSAVQGFVNQARDAIANVPLHDVAAWIKERDPSRVNKVLSTMVKKIIINKDRTVTLEPHTPE